MRDHAGAAWPHEACGLLLRPGPDPAGRRLAAVSCRNVAEDPARAYTIDPEAFLHIEHRARRSGGTVVGVWHSHPHGDAAASERDRRDAWPEWSYVILGATGCRITGIRAWRVVGEHLNEQRVEIG